MPTKRELLIPLTRSELLAIAQRFEVPVSCRSVEPPPPSSKPAPSGNGKQFTRSSEITAFIWSVADLLRGDYKQAA